jgi:protein MpaA
LIPHGCAVGPLTAAIALVMVSGGCEAVRITRESPSPSDAERQASATTERIGWSVQERAIECVTIGDGGETILIIASIHGDEPAGTTLLAEMERTLRERPELIAGRRIVLVPVANPDGLANGTRTNASGVDLNRNFPAGNWRGHRRHGDKPLSEPESRAIHELIAREQPTRIVSIHQPVSCIDYDGPASGLAALIGARCELPVRKLGGRPGSLGSYAGHTLGIPIITLELPGTASRAGGPELWARYGDAMLAAVTYRAK